MTKAKDQKPDRNRKAPVEITSAAPSQRSPGKQGRSQRESDDQDKKRESKRIPFPAKKSSLKTEPTKNAEVGARISRRAADRLRAGHVWVYASDIESIETGTREGEAP